MGREVRKVPANWQHPKRASGRYIALYDSCYESRAKEWDEESAKWGNGEFPSYASEESQSLTYAEWSGERPKAEDYMPEWPDSECTHYMMYETTSEGTPISPSFPTPEELARWLSDNNASAFGDMTATYEQWLRVANGGFACSAVVAGGKLESGVAGL